MPQLNESQLAKILLVLQEAQKLFYYILNKEKIKIPCKEGCHWCCYEPVESTMAEAYLIADFIEKSPSIVKDGLLASLQDWLSWFKENNRPVIPEVYRSHKKLCPFCQDGICTIYPIRPLTCRTYVVPDGPELCKSDRDQDGTLPIVPTTTSAAWMALDRRVHIFQEALCAALGLTPEKGLIIKENLIVMLARVRREAMQGNETFKAVEKAVQFYQEILKASSD